MRNLYKAPLTSAAGESSSRSVDEVLACAFKMFCRLMQAMCCRLMQALCCRLMLRLIDCRSMQTMCYRLMQRSYTDSEQYVGTEERTVQLPLKLAGTKTCSLLLEEGRRT